MDGWMDERKFDFAQCIAMHRCSTIESSVNLSDFLLTCRTETVAGCTSSTEEEKQEVSACPAVAEEVRLEAATL